MKEKEKFPVRVEADGGNDGPFKAATSISSLSGGPGNIRRELAFVETDYALLIKGLRAVLSSAERKADPRLYRLAGDNIIRYFERLDDAGFYLLEQNKTIGRDVGLSDSSIGKMTAFRRRYRKISMVDPSATWSSCRGGKSKTR